MRGTLLQQQLADPVEDQHMGGAMHQRRIAMAFSPRRRTDHPVIVIDDVEKFHN